MTTEMIDSTMLSAGLLIGRLVVGLAMAAHGAQKLFGWFGGPGLEQTSGSFEMLGFRPGRLFAAAASTAEITGGSLVALGLLGPVGPGLVVSVMVVAVIAVHWKSGFFAATNGIELPTLFATVTSLLALIGPGRFSLDAVFGLERLWTPELAVAAILVGLIGGIAALLARRSAAAPLTARSDVEIP